GEPYYLKVGVDYVVGRKNCPILLQSDQSISRVHAHLTVNTPAAVQVNTEFHFSFLLKYKSIICFPPCRVEYESLIVCSSCLDGQGKITLNQSVQQLGGCVVNNWTQDCTHLVMPSMKVTIKV
ncbi:NBN protein, partial [Polyodon spathula]|nr:NBN protein [Polyodon spathula]